MNKCQNCGVFVPVEKAFCPNCSEPIEPEEAPNRAASSSSDMMQTIRDDPNNYKELLLSLKKVKPVKPAAVAPEPMKPAAVPPAPMKPAAVPPAPVKPAAIPPAPVQPAAVPPARARAAAVTPDPGPRRAPAPVVSPRVQPMIPQPAPPGKSSNLNVILILGGVAFLILVLIILLAFELI